MPEVPSLSEPSAYTIERTRTSAEHIARYAALLTEVFPSASHFTEAYLRWQYVDNPDGKVIGFDALAGAQLAAHYVTIPMVARMSGRDVRGVLSLNTATHPAHQGKGLFTRLAAATYDAARQEGCEFVVGVANQNSTPGFLRKLGFSLVSPLDVRVGLGGPARSSISPGFERAWSADAMLWRLSNPSATYRCAGGRVFADAGMPGIRMITSTRAFPGRKAGAGFLVAHPISAWIGLAPRLHWNGIALTVPSKLRPSPLNFIFKSLGDLSAPSGDDTLFEALDFDAY